MKVGCLVLLRLEAHRVGEDDGRWQGDVVKHPAAAAEGGVACGSKSVLRERRT